MEISSGASYSFVLFSYHLSPFPVQVSCDVILLCVSPCFLKSHLCLVYSLPVLCCQSPVMCMCLVLLPLSQCTSIHMLSPRCFHSRYLLCIYCLAQFFDALSYMFPASCEPPSLSCFHSGSQGFCIMDPVLLWVGILYFEFCISATQLTHKSQIINKTSYGY